MSAFVGVIVGLLQGLLSIFGLGQPAPASPQLPPDLVINPAQQTITQATNVVVPNPQQTDTSPHAVFPFVGDDAAAMTYENSQYGFSIEYPSDVQINTTPASQESFVANINAGTKLAVIGPIKKSFTATESGWGDNGVVTTDGKVIISVSTDPSDVANCTVAPAGVEVGPSNITSKDINGMSFLSYDVDQPAAGLLGLDHTYTAVHNGICYSIDASISGAESGHMNASDAAANDAVLAHLTAELDSIAQRFFFDSNNRPPISVPGMSKYTDADFGFSFWYPSGWTVTASSTIERGCYSGVDGSAPIKTLTLSGGKQPVVMSEFVSSSGILYSCGKAYDKFYFDQNIKAWMYAPRWSNYASGIPGKAAPPEINFRTMGGLPLWGGIVPLNSDHFILIDIDGTDDPRVNILKTIVGTDPAVATPVGTAEQTATIQAEQRAYAGN